MSDPMPFSQHWEVRIPMRIDAIGDLGAALQNSYTSFKPGDLIQVSSFTTRDFVRLLEVADFRVVSCNSFKLETVQVTETVKVPEVRPEYDPASQQNLEIREVRGAFEVCDQLGNIIELFTEKKQAEVFIENYRKITTPVVQPKAEDRSRWIVKKTVSGKWCVRNSDGELIKEFSRRDEAEAFLGEQVKAA